MSQNPHFYMLLAILLVLKADNDDIEEKHPEIILII